MSFFSKQMKDPVSWKAAQTVHHGDRKYICQQSGTIEQCSLWTLSEMITFLDIWMENDLFHIDSVLSSQTTAVGLVHRDDGLNEAFVLQLDRLFCCLYKVVFLSVQI